MQQGYLRLRKKRFEPPRGGSLCVVTFSVGVGFALLQVIGVVCSRMQAIVGTDLEQCSDFGLRKIRKAIGIGHVSPFVERDIGPP